MADENNIPSLEDFYEEDLMGNFEEEEEQEEATDEEAEEEQEEESSEEESEEQEEEPPVKKKKASPKEEESESEESEETEEGEEEESEPEGVFWDDVEKITGFKVEVDYKGVDPESPEGAALREEAVSNHAINSFIDEMKEKMPKVYRVFEHALAGGTPEDLYKPGEKDYTTVELKEDDEDHAKSILQEYYHKKGLSKARIERLIEIDEDSEEGLIKTAKTYLKEMADAQEESRAARAEEQKTRAEEQKRKDQEFLSTIDGILGTGKIGSFVLPKKDSTGFNEFIRSKIQRDGKGGYVAVTPLAASELENQLQYEYFRYKQGNLDSLIQHKAKTEQVRKLKRNIDNSKGKPKSSSSGDSGTKRLRTLKDFEQ